MSVPTPARTFAVLGLVMLVFGVLFATAHPGVSQARPGPGPCTNGPNAQIIDRGSIGVMLSWTSGSVPASGWDIARSQDGVTWTTIATVPPSAACTAVHYLDTDGLAPDTTYSYTVGGSSPISVKTSPGPVIVQPVGDPSQAVRSYPAGICDDTGGCTQWAEVVDAPFGGNIEIVGDRVGCGSGCGRYNAKAEFTYADAQTAPLEVTPPAGYQLDDGFPSYGLYGGDNVGDSTWLSGQTLLNRTGQPLLVLCSDYPVNPSPSNVAEVVNAFAQLLVVDPADPHHAWVYLVRAGGNTPACNTTGGSTATETTYKWGQLWTADVTAQLYHSGRLVTSQNLGSLTIGHHGWKFSHHAGRYSVRVCGTHRRRSATAARACITRRYSF